MGWIVDVLLCFVALALQATLVPHVRIASIGPDLPLLATVLLAYARGATVGTSAGFLIGLAQDLTNPAYLGLNALCKALLGYTAGAVREQIDAGSTLVHGAVLFVAVLAHDLVYLTVFTRGALSELLPSLLTRSLPTALYTALIGMWLFTALASVSRRGVRSFGPSRLARR